MERDLQKKSFFSDEERFADLINGIVGSGKKIVTPSDLVDVDSQTGFAKLLPAFGEKKRKRKQHYRDMVKKAVFGMNFLVIGLENQEEVHYLMPLRCMAYEVDEYEHQAMKIRRRVRKQKGISTAEFLSGFTRQERLKPCITLVLYYGEDWDGAKSLHSLLDFMDIPREFYGLVNEYNMHICEVRKFEDTDVFQTDLKQVFDFIKYSKDPEKLYELVMKDSAYQELDEDTYEIIAEYTKSKELMEIKKQKQEGGTVNMCEAITELIQRGRMEGVMQGITQGIEQGMQALIETCIEFGSTRKETLDRVMEKMQVPQEDAERYVEKYWHSK